jgi:hypothetical protein
MSVALSVCCYILLAGVTVIPPYPTHPRAPLVLYSISLRSPGSQLRPPAFPFSLCTPPQGICQREQHFPHGTRFSSCVQFLLITWSPSQAALPWMGVRENVRSDPLSLQ